MRFPILVLPCLFTTLLMVAGQDRKQIRMPTSDSIIEMDGKERSWEFLSEIPGNKWLTHWLTVTNVRNK